MDEAAISTIHGWAQRMLREHAFDSGRLFEQEVISDLSTLKREAVQDYWRSRVYPLSTGQAAALIEQFDSPAALQSALEPLLQRPDAALRYRGEALCTDTLEHQLAQAEARRQALADLEDRARTTYRRTATAIHEALDTLRPAMNGNVFRHKDDEPTYAAWMQELRDWGYGELALQDAAFVQKLARGRFTLKKGSEPPESSLHDELERWRELASTSAESSGLLRAAVLQDAHQWVTRRLAETLDTRSLLSFDGMINGLDEALAAGGANGEATAVGRAPAASRVGAELAARIRAQFPVALIDEFQDTDPAQYRIFSRIYGDLRTDGVQAAGALVLIGDPKQAIYSFRGGDIHTYLAARRDTAGHHHSLDTNFRATTAAVGAVNRLFEHAEARHDKGAFRFAEETAPASNPLPFQPVNAKGLSHELVLDAAPAPALLGWLLSPTGEQETLNKTQYLQQAAQHCANRIADWLNQGLRKEAGFRLNGGTTIDALRPEHIAVLVRDRQEADMIRGALMQRGLPSVYLSDRNSVFDSAEASDLLFWLRAMASPGDGAALRAALATPSLGLGLAQLDALQADELAWEQASARFGRYGQRWQQQGVMTALRQLLHEYAVPAALLAREDGERRLTNLLHLAEWAQQASEALDGEHALIRSLATHIDQREGHEQLLRLESDAQLIQVVTIFKSKGLEYPLVCLPFACTYRTVDLARGAALFHDNGAPRLELARSGTEAGHSVAQANEERLSEEVRLLYVALTRARHCTCLGLAPLRTGRSGSALHHSALGWLLAGGEHIENAAQLEDRWHAMAGKQPGLQLEPAQSAPARYQGKDTRPDTGQALRVSHPPFAPWSIASYSALQQLGGSAPETPAAAVMAEEQTAAEPLEPAAAQAPADEAYGLHAFPRGPGPGTFLHEVMEALAERGFALAPHDSTLPAQLTARCARRGWEAHAPTLISAVQDWLSTPLAPNGEPGPSLCTLERYRAEPDFWFTVNAAQTTALDRCVRASILPGVARPALAPQQLDGLLKGFIDLLAEHAGRYWVIDWKSNWLGNDDRAYQRDALEQAMLHKRYDVQLALYLVALHRHLLQTLRDYDYERDVAGAMLVFLRGIGANTRGVLQIKPSRAQIEALDDCLAGHGDRRGERR